MRYSIYLRAKVSIILCTTLLLIACQAKDMILVVPSQHDGHVGEVKLILEKTLESVILNQAYMTVKADPMATEVITTDADFVNQNFAHANAATPPPATSILLYFITNSNQLTTFSQQKLPKIKEEIAWRNAPEVILIGHTDTVGSIDANDRLALERAQTVHQLLTEQGIHPGIIRAQSRGERSPLIKTADEVPEANNRRVEVKIR